MPSPLHHTPWRAARVAVSTVLALAAMPSHAAGGHFAVDDATLLDPGTCQVETWLDRRPVSSDWLEHIGPGCRVGFAELSLNLEQVQPIDGPAFSTAGAQVKVAHAFGQSIAAGLVVASAGRTRPDGYAGSSVVVPLSWFATPTLALHANLGRTVVPGHGDTAIDGVAFEWSPTARWTAIGERFADAGHHFWRAGVRWSPTATFDIDASVARDATARATRRWTVGATWMWDR